MPTMDEILQLSTNASTYSWFLSVFLKNGVGGKNWNQTHLRQPITKFITSSSEAIVILIMENNYARWIDEAENEEKDKKDLAPALYTNSGISQRGGNATSRQGGGWSQEGIQRFNELVMLVRNDQKGRLGFEVALMKSMLEVNTVKSWNTEKRKAQAIDYQDEVVAVNDFDDSGDETEEDQDATEVKV